MAPITRKILVPLDGSELADRIVAHVRRLLHADDGEVVLLHVASDREPEGGAAHVERLRDELRDGGARATSRVVLGDPAAEILAVADEISPSLVAMSTHGRSGVARFLRGSVAERVLSRSSFPVLLGNPLALGAGQELRIRRILVPLDGSALSAEVLPRAVELAQLFGAELVLFHSIDPSSVRLPGSALALTLEDADALLRGRLEGVEGVSVRLRVGRGMAAATILEAAEQEHADLIALTTHGESGRSRWAFGSVADKVLRHARCPLLVVRTAAVASPTELAGAARAASAH